MKRWIVHEQERDDNGKFLPVVTECAHCDYEPDLCDCNETHFTAAKELGCSYGEAEERHRFSYRWKSELKDWVYEMIQEIYHEVPDRLLWYVDTDKWWSDCESDYYTIEADNQFHIYEGY